MAYLRVSGGQLELLASPDTPFLCFEPPVEAWREPVAMTFD
jgi:hypothetical protein